MSKVEEKQSFALDPIDSENLQLIVERFTALKINADKANEALAKIQGQYIRNMERICAPNGVAAADYRPDFAAGLVVPKSPPIAPAPRQVVSAPDSTEPEAPVPVTDKA